MSDGEMVSDGKKKSNVSSHLLRASDKPTEPLFIYVQKPKGFGFLAMSAMER